MRKYLNLKLITSLLLIVVGIVWLNMAQKLGSAGVGDSSIWGTGGTLPKFYLYIYLVLNVSIFISELIAVRKSTEEPDFKTALKVIGFIALLVVYTFVITYIGYIISTIVLLVATMLLLGERNKILLAAVPVGFTMLLYVVFEFALHINLP